MQDDFRIGEWLVQPRINSLERNGTVRRLEPKVMQVLVALAREPGEVVTRERIREQVWPNVFVGEDVLIRAVSEIRRAFGDDSQAPQMIQTIPKVGYRLIAEVTTFEEQISDLNSPIEETPEVADALPFTSIANKARRTYVLLFIILLILGMICGIAWFKFRPNPQPNFIVRPLTTYPGEQFHPAFAPNGQAVAFVWQKEDEPGHIYIRTLTSAVPIRLLTQEGDAEFSPAWSPDGHTIALVRQSGEKAVVETVPATGGTERLLYTLPVNNIWEYGGLAWSAEGDKLIFPQYSKLNGPSQLMEITLLDGSVRPLTSPNFNWDGDSMPAVSPDGKTLAFTRSFERSTRDLYVMTLPAGMPRRITFDNRMINGITWTSDGASIVFASNRGGSMALWHVAAKDGAPEREPFGAENANSPSIALRGDKMVFSHGNAAWAISQIDLTAVDKEETELLSGSEQDGSPTISPSGKKLAFQSWRSGRQDIWISDIDGKNAVQLTDGRGFSGSPAWSPSGRQIAFDSHRNGFFRVCLMGAQGEDPHPLPGGAYDDIVPSWSLDGRYLYFNSNRSGSWQIWRTAADGFGAAEQITVNGGFVAKASPDGQWIFYTRLNEPGLWKRAVSGGPELKVADIPPTPYQNYWAIVGHGIYLLEMQDDHAVLVHLDPDSGRKNVVYTLHHHPSLFSGLTVTADEKHLIFAELIRSESNLTIVENFR